MGTIHSSFNVMVVHQHDSQMVKKEIAEEINLNKAPSNDGGKTAAIKVVVAHLTARILPNELFFTRELFFQDFMQQVCGLRNL